MTMAIRSEAFGHQQRIPRRFTADGDDVSPPLAWSDLPEGTRELALIMDDPDAPTDEPWVHWLIYHIPSAAGGLPEAIEKAGGVHAPVGAQQGRNSWGSLGYRGPAPPPGHGLHHYHFRLYALDEPLHASAGLDKPTLRMAMAGHVLAEAELIGTYERDRRH